METANYLNPEILKPLEDDSKTLSEKLFAISKYFSPFLYHSVERDPSDLEKHEAMIFACFWTLKITITSYNLPSDTQNQILLQIYVDTDDEMKSKIIMSEDGLKIYSNRIHFYLKETNKMKEQNFNYLPILDKLYLSPLSSSSKINSNPDPIEYLRLVSTFSIGLKKYDELVKETISSLRQLK
jgi:hypothetical protein